MTRIEFNCFKVFPSFSLWEPSRAVKYQYHNTVMTYFTFVWLCIVTNFFILKPTRCTNFTNLFWHETCRVSRQNKFVKLVHLVGFIIKKKKKSHDFVYSMHKQWIRPLCKNWGYTKSKVHGNISHFGYKVVSDFCEIISITLH